MESCLVVTALGRDRPGIVKSLTKALTRHQANISESRMTVLGGEFAVMMLVAASDAAIASLEQERPALESELGLNIHMKRTLPRPLASGVVPYVVTVVAMDHPGIVHDVTDFFAAKGLNIESLETTNYAAAHTGTLMFSLSMVVAVPSAIKASQLRSQFVDFCDDLNLDATLELHD
ncbi:MAG: glycine cleavage system protein R [Gammaproteobacteria bacterium]|nr:glycine cleavage system protein R [Gammaproteobacteria bacterium]